MRLQGKITRWNDERGFGFISWHADGSSAFVHIKAFPRMSRRPEVGDIVSYEVVKSKDGSSRAEKVRFAEQPQPKASSVGKRQSSSLPVLFTTFFVCSLFIAAYLNRISWLLVVAYLGLSLVTFLLYGWDKSSARLGKWRTTESSLHVMGLVGGWPGALAAQRLLRHKSSKQEFLSTFRITVSLNVAAVSFLVWTGHANPINQLIDGLWKHTV